MINRPTGSCSMKSGDSGKGLFYSYYGWSVSIIFLIYSNKISYIASQTVSFIVLELLQEVCPSFELSNEMRGLVLK